MAATSSVFPIELYELIIDWVHWQGLRSDQQPYVRLSALRACALTCRTWFHRSQTNLFFQLFIIQTSHYRSTILPIQIAQILQDKPHLCSHVRCIYLTLPDPTSALLVLGPLTPNLRNLYINCHQLPQRTFPNPDFYAAINTFRRSIRTLAIWHTNKMGGHDHLFDTVALFRLMERIPNLRVLEIDRFTLYAPSVRIPAFLNTHRLRLHTLILRIYPLTIPWEDLSEALTKNRSFLSTLRRLCIWNAGYLSDRINLTCTGLRRIYFTYCVADLTIHNFTNLAQRLPDTGIEEIHITLAISIRRLREEEYWRKPLDMALTATSPKTLRAVRFGLECPSDEDSATDLGELLPNLFPLLHARGILGSGATGADEICQTWRLEPAFQGDTE
ncbi:hypothetical protein K474DRAFT_1517602 [Panus rudis PR-1116 ss-1]|nr:hypothetical protein K474DRAFT_1517602 [Panus rudis PR-1116 ss-1]